jgi:tRNA(fMet)-specific endonuclease VapC
LTAPTVYMLDTDTCIFLTRGASAKLAAKLQSVPLQQQVMSAVTYAELAYGVQASAPAKRKQNQAVLDSLALHLAVLDWPQEAAQHYAEIRFDLKKRGAQLGAADLMIAAHARAMGAIVVTNNTKDFGRVKGLQVENWTK